MDLATSTVALMSPPRAPGSSIPPAPPLADPRNTIARPEESSTTHNHFSLSEGTYRLRDEVTLGPVPPHPSDTSALPQSVLDTRIPTPTAGVSLSLAILAPRRSTISRSRSFNASSFKSSVLPGAADSSHESSKHSSDQGSRGGEYGGNTSKSRFGEMNLALNPPNAKEPKDPMKRKKPKNGITKSSSSFVSRALPHESLQKRLSDHKEEGIFAFASIGRAMLWLDLSSPTKQEQLMKILFTKAHALCHDFNDYSKTPNHIELIMGFNTSEFIWYEAFSQKYTRLNKNGAVTSSPVSCIRWLPGSENLFISAHFDGTLAVYDKEKDDAPFLPEENIIAAPRASTDGRPLPRLVIRKSVQSKNQKTNPVAVYKATRQRINGMAFSPDGKYLALACEDGSLRIIDFLREELVDLYRSYYGGFTCVCWSPDSMYLLSGGQDDLISIWSAEDRSLLARCVGHRSWISFVAFDPWKCDETTYRFGSVGDDGRLLLWDFSVGMLNQPRSASIRQSISSHTPSGPERHDSDATVRRLPSGPPIVERASEEDADDITHPVLPRSAVAMLPPVMSMEVDPHAMSFVRFEEDSIIMACQQGHIRTWDRPVAGNGQPTHQYGGIAI